MLLGVARRRIIMRHRSFFIGITLALIMTVSGLAQAQGGHNRVNAEQLSAADLARYTTARAPGLRTSAAHVMDQREGVVLFGLFVCVLCLFAFVFLLLFALVLL